MAAALRIVLWTVALVAPGGFLLVPVLAAKSIRERRGADKPAPRVGSA